MTISLASMIVSSLACSSTPESFARVLDGKVSLVDSDREAILELLQASGTAADDLRLLRPEDGSSGRRPFARIEEGRVVELALSGLSTAEPITALKAIRNLRLTGSFSTFELRQFNELEFVHIDSAGSELQSLHLADLPRLTELIVDSAHLDGDIVLAQLPELRTLGLLNCGLASIPEYELPRLTDLALAGNHLANLESLAPFTELERLQLSANDIESLDTLPQLPNLRRLSVSDNPLRPDVALAAATVPRLVRLDARRTGLRTKPAGLEELDSLKLELDQEVSEQIAFEESLARLRLSYQAKADELTPELRGTGGTILESRGKCQWQVGTFHRGRVSCQLNFGAVRGTAAARLGTTNVALPFQGGGTPRVRVTLRVRQGEAAVYVRESFDLVSIARLLTEVDESMAESARQAGDRFHGYRRLVARPGTPAIGQGEVILLGSRVVLWVEAIGGEAKEVELLVEPI